MKKLVLMMCFVAINSMNAQQVIAEGLEAKTLRYNQKANLWDYIDANGQSSKILVKDDFVILKDDDGKDQIMAKKEYYIPTSKPADLKILVQATIPQNMFNETIVKQINIFISEVHELYSADKVASKNKIKLANIIVEPNDPNNLILMLETVYYNSKKQKKTKTAHYAFNMISEHTELLNL